MNLTRKLKAASLAGILGATAILNSGCTSAQMDNAANAFFGGGGLAHAAGRTYQNNEEYMKANAAYAIGDAQRAAYERETAMQAAEASKSHITINVNDSRPQTVGAAKNYSQIYEGARLTNWVDDGDKVFNPQKDIVQSNCSLFKRDSTIKFSLDYRVYGNRNFKITIEDGSGREIFEAESFLKIDPRKKMPEGFIYAHVGSFDISRYKDANGNFPKGVVEGIFKVYLLGENTPKDSKRITIDFDHSFR